MAETRTAIGSESGGEALNATLDMLRALGLRVLAAPHFQYPVTYSRATNAAFVRTRVDDDVERAAQWLAEQVMFGDADASGGALVEKPDWVQEANHG